MEPIELQQRFFQHIKSRIPANFSLVDEISDLLNISTDSAYRRIRGEKALSFEEIQKLCRQYNISLDHIMNIESNSTVFFGNWLDAENFDFEQYLKDMLLQAQAIQKASHKMIYYEAKDIPPFHHFQFPELAAFKYFFWMKTILAYPECSKMYYEDNDLKGVLHKTGTEILRTYNQIHSAEIWSIETVNITIRQIEYYREAGVFKKKESVDILYDQLLAMTDHIKYQAECGEKLLLNQNPLGNRNFQLYYNEVYLGHNTILTDADDIHSVFINHGVLNYMITRDKRFVDYTRKYFENTMSKSSLISSVNEKERTRFFNQLNQKVTQSRNNLALQNENKQSYF